MDNLTTTLDPSKGRNEECRQALHKFQQKVHELEEQLIKSLDELGVARQQRTHSL